MGSDDAPHIPPSGGSRKVKCKGRTVIRWDENTDEHRRGDPKLDADGLRQYRPCVAWAANGTDYCSAHGGTTPAAINAAKRTIALATPGAAEVLQEILHDNSQTADARIKAAIQILDRGGVRPGVDVSVETPGWQKVLGKMFGSSTQDDEPEAVEAEAPPAEVPPPPPPRKRETKTAPPPEPVPDNVRKLVPRKATKATPPQHKW